METDFIAEEMKTGHFRIWPVSDKGRDFRDASFAIVGAKFKDQAIKELTDSGLDVEIRIIK